MAKGSNANDLSQKNHDTIAEVLEKHLVSGLDFALQVFNELAWSSMSNALFAFTDDYAKRGKLSISGTFPFFLFMQRLV